MSYQMTHDMAEGMSIVTYNVYSETPHVIMCHMRKGPWFCVMDNIFERPTKIRLIEVLR